MRLPIRLAATAAAVVGAASCDLPHHATVEDLRSRADALFSEGTHGAADAADSCLARALAQITSQLEALAAEAEALRAYREARQLNPHAKPGTDGCVISADGSSICLARTSAAATAAAAAAGAAATAAGAASPSAGSIGVSMGELPQRVEECVSEGEALALLQRHDRGECGAACSSPDALESALVSAAHRHWWEAARGAVDRLRRQNLQVGHETRRSLTLLRDEAGSVLTLLR